jgi:hypothetical protein
LLTYRCVRVKPQLTAPSPWTRVPGRSSPEVIWEDADITPQVPHGGDIPDKALGLSSCPQSRALAWPFPESYVKIRETFVKE